MSQSTLWLSIEPRLAYCQMHLSLSGLGTLMKARLAAEPVHGGVAMLMEALSAWHGRPLCAVLDADAEESSDTRSAGFATAADVVNDLVAGQSRNTLHRRLVAWSSPELLLMDGLGYLSFDARGADLLYQVFNKRHRRASTIVTTNLPFKDWGKLFHSAAAASAIADRLVEQGILIRISGKSRRSNQELDAA